MSAVAARNTLSAPEQYRAAFEARLHSDGPLLAVRRAALDRFAVSGFPTQRDEDWKYTNLRRLESRSFRRRRWHLLPPMMRTGLRARVPESFW